ncbi:MAG: M81 family metallopeptidase [Chloroflexota bacterium]|nr:M81 family metallopeptidase [Chloroflexota bacterium]
MTHRYRIAIGEFAHETNTFCSSPTTTEPFKEYQWFVGDDIVRAHGGNRTYVGGMLAAADERGIAALPTFGATAYPSGTITRAAYDEILATLLAEIERAMPVDAVCLALHGAGVAEGIDDLEGAVLAAVRERVGPDVPIAASLDLHGNITPLMLEHADGLFGNWYYPHSDSYERGAEAINFLYRLLEREIRPTMHLEQLPVMIPTCSTDLEPGMRLNALCREWEQRPGMIDCTIFHGFPYTDVPAVGMSVLTITDDDPALAAEAGKAVAQAIWEAREEYRPEILTATEAISRALAVPNGPVVLNDTSDNPGGGSPGDSTHLLRAMLAMELENACYAYIFDPETAAQVHAAGVGATIDVRLGGKTDDLHGAPIEAAAYVKCLTDGQFRLTTPMGRGMLVEIGPMARLRIGGMDVLVGSRRNQVLDDEIFLLHGIDVRRYRIVAVKSSAHFRAGFTHLATAIIAADAPGATTLDLSGFPYHRIRRTIWPLDATEMRGGYEQYL